MKICILDDTEYVIDFLKRKLAGHDILAFTDPKSFLASITDEINVIITDLKVPRYDAINHIRAFKEKNSAVKVIVISAHFTDKVLFQLIDCHIYKAVQKTHEMDWFDEVVKAVNK